MSEIQLTRRDLLKCSIAAGLRCCCGDWLSFGSHGSERKCGVARSGAGIREI